MDQAPDFSLQDQNGTTHSLADYAGKWLVLYFYPADDTPGCTTEACNFRDERDAIAQFGNAVVIGVSKDTVVFGRAPQYVYYFARRPCCQRISRRRP
jgi:peroxiredoxin Q/BCP